jgi:hypothetical protein
MMERPSKSRGPRRWNRNCQDRANTPQVRWQLEGTRPPVTHLSFSDYPLAGVLTTHQYIHHLVRTAHGLAAPLPDLLALFLRLALPCVLAICISPPFLRVTDTLEPILPGLVSFC